MVMTSLNRNTVKALPGKRQVSPDNKSLAVEWHEDQYLTSPGLPTSRGWATIAKSGNKGETMIDLVIRGDRVVTPQGVGAHDILIAGGTIAAIAAPGSIALPQGTRVIDATGKIVIPGGIDPHVHCKWHLPSPDGTATETAPPDV